MPNSYYLKVDEGLCDIPHDTSMMAYLDYLLSISPSPKTLTSLKRKLKSAARKGESHHTARLLLSLGRYYLMACDYKKSIAYYLRSLDGFRHHEDINGIIITTISLSQAYNFLSDFVQVGRLNMQLHEMLFQSDDPIAKAYIRLNMAEHAILNMAEHAVVVGKMAYMETDIKEIYDISRRQRCWYLYCTASMLIGYLRLEKGDVDSAIFYLKNARKLIERYNMPAMFTYYTYHLLPEAYWLEYKIHAQRLTPAQKKAAIARIKRLCELALRKTTACLFHHGSALRIKAKYLILEGRTKDAEHFFLKSIKYCSKFRRRFELGLSFYFYAYLLKLTGQEKEMMTKLQTARRFFKEVGATIYLRRISDILGTQEETISSDARNGQSQTLATIINISRKLGTIKELEELTFQILQNALELTGADSGCLFIKNEKEKPELKAALGLSTARAERKLAANRSRSTFNLPFELQIPIRIGNREIGFCHLYKKKSSEKFNGHATGSIYLFMSQVAALIENCRLIKILSQKKDDHRCSISLPTEKKLKKAVAYIRNNYSSAISRNELAERLNINADNLGRFFKKYTGYKISEYTNRLRMEEAARMLEETDTKVIEIAFSVGFESLTTFNRVFSNALKTTPSKYRKRKQEKSKDRMPALKSI